MGRSNFPPWENRPEVISLRRFESADTPSSETFYRLCLSNWLLRFVHLSSFVRGGGFREGAVREIRSLRALLTFHFIVTRASPPGPPDKLNEPYKKNFFNLPAFVRDNRPTLPGRTLRPLAPLPKDDGLLGKAFVLLNYTRIFFTFYFLIKPYARQFESFYFIFLKKTVEFFWLNHLLVVEYLNL